ncbi:MAG: HEPN domain-containing protein [Treponema sp.]|jgi:HEPN domain-containing protein|nr:HEPN domain-containing protein [Treponema sp.]
MSKSLVTESAEMLCHKAEKDILNVKVLFDKNFYPEDLMYDIICFHATQATEKFLKSYIISNGKTVEKIHDLDILQKAAMEIDNSFSKIMDNCLLLNEFVPNVKYDDDENPVTKQNINDIIKSLNAICNFPPIKTMRDSFGKKRSYKIVTEIITKPSAKKPPKI